MHLSLFTFVISAAATTWDPGADYRQRFIWPGKPPNSENTSILPENMMQGDHPVAGKPISVISNVARPTMTVYPPKGANSGAAIVVFPGGGYRKLAIDLEGTEVCDWLTAKGITCVLLKYRVPDSGCHWDPELKRHVVPKIFTALQDAQRTVGLLRFEAIKWKIDPKKIGVIGFSAGGHLVASLSTNYKQHIYPDIDAADGRV